MLETDAHLKIVGEAENGEDALVKVEQHSPEVVLIDIHMPVMDGLTATRAIREAERRDGLARTPIHALTANAMAEHAKASAEAGVDGHLTKPISAEALLKAVAEAGASGSAGAARLRA